MSTMGSTPEAEPQSRDEVRRAPRCPEVVTAATEHGITSIVHFTTVKNLIAILASGAVKSRQDLPEDESVKHVFEPNAVERHLDQLWHNYVNLSVTAIDLHMFRFSAREHPGANWVILEFGPEILGGGGVVFCTTNNIYPSARRGRGLGGFKQLFAPTVSGRYGQPAPRGDRPPYRATDPQSEVLYPFELSLKHLHAVTVADDDAYDAVEAAFSHFPYAPKIKKDPEAFR